MNGSYSFPVADSTSGNFNADTLSGNLKASHAFEFDEGVLRLIPSVGIEAMNQMNATVQEVARNAGQASVASSETKEKAESGSAIVQKSLLSIGRVQTVSQELKQDMA